MEECEMRYSMHSEFKIIECIVNDIKISGKVISKNSYGTDYLCSLCNHTIAHSPNDKKCRLSLWTHINEATHQKNVRSLNNNDKKIYENSKQTKKTPKLACVQLKNALDSFQLSKQERIMSSRQFIIENNEGNAFHCTLCNVELLHSSINDVEFRFNLLVHINEKGHGYKLSAAYKNCNDKIKSKRKRAITTKATNKDCYESEYEESQITQVEEDNVKKGTKVFEKVLVDDSDDLLKKESADKNSANKEEGEEFVLRKSNVDVEYLKQLGNTLDYDESQPFSLRLRMKKQFVEKSEKCKKKSGKKVDKLREFFDSFDQGNPVTVISKYFTKKGSEGKDYYCTLCNVEILYPLNANEFRFNLWSHINGKNHREKLPNYKDMITSFEKEKENISKSLTVAHKSDAEYFEIGDKYRFAKCSLCDVAVSLNFHRLTNHIQNEKHANNRRLIMLGRDLIKQDSQVRSRREYNVLKSKIDGKFSKDMKFIQPGEMPGYLVCVVCCTVVLPTKYYLETHLEKDFHIQNCSLRPVIKSKMNLRDLMEKIPSDLKEFQNIFVEDKYGVKCCRCQEVIPATTHDLYSHINKERENDKSKFEEK